MAIWKQTRTVDTTVTEQAGLCHKLARRVFNIPAGGPKGEAIGSAWAAWTFSNTKHTDRNFPTNVAVPIWFSHYGTYSGKYGNWGHVVVWIPGKGYLSSPPAGFGQRYYSTIQAVEKTFNAKFVGWTEDINGRRVIERVALQANQRQVKATSRVNRRTAASTAAKEVLPKFEANAVVTMLGYVRGQTLDGNDLWYVDTTETKSWSGGYTSVSTDGLKDLTAKPEPVVTTERVEVVEVLEFERIRQANDMQPVEWEQVTQEGADGAVTRVYEVTFTDGIETSRELVSETVVEPVVEVTEYGTIISEPEPEPTPEPVPDNSKRVQGIIVIIGAVLAAIVALFATTGG